MQQYFILITLYFLTFQLIVEIIKCKERKTLTLDPKNIGFNEC